MKQWTGIDLDGTLAFYDGSWPAEDVIGDPIPESVAFVKRLLEQGEEVRIFTARINAVGRPLDKVEKNYEAIVAWCKKHIGQELVITCVKDRFMKQLYDDLAVPVKRNEGIKENICKFHYRLGGGHYTGCGKSLVDETEFVYCPFCGGKFI